MRWMLFFDGRRAKRACPVERRRILERTASGRADAKAKGVKFGRKPTLTPHRQQVPRQRLAAGETQRSVARSYNVSQATISRLVPSGVWLELKVA